MRPLPKSLAGIAVTLGLVGCSLMVSFEDPGEAPTQVIVGKDSGPKADRAAPGDDDDNASSSSSSSSSTSSSSSSGGTLPAGCDPAIDLTTIDCGTKTSSTCGRNMVGARPGVGDDDIVECPAAGGKPTCVRRCANGCVTTETTNECNPCGAGGKPDGTYCERDLPNFPTDEQAGTQFAAKCEGGQFTRVANCGTGKVLTSGPSAGKRAICESTCTRAGTTLKPSCCTTADP